MRLEWVDSGLVFAFWCALTSCMHCGWVAATHGMLAAKD